MKKVQKIAVIIYSLFMVGLGACSKDIPSDSHQITNQNTKTSGNVLGFTIEGTSAHNKDYYRLIDVDSSIFQWRSFHNGEFLFDKEIVWDIENGIHRISNIGANSFDIEYENGDSVHVFEVSSMGALTTFRLYNEDSEMVKISITFDSTVNFMDAISSIAHIGNSKFIPPWFFYGAAVLAVSIVDTYYAVKCEVEIKKGVELCTSHSSHCRAKKHICSVECYSNIPECTCNCGQYSTFI